MYEFAADAGGMERSRYFGLSKGALHSMHSVLVRTESLTNVSTSADLYHLDHFLAIRAMPAYAPLFKSVAFTVAEPVAGPDGTLDVEATVESGGGLHSFIFRMTQGMEGSKSGCWLVAKLLPKGSKYL